MFQQADIVSQRPGLRHLLAVTGTALTLAFAPTLSLARGAPESFADLAEQISPAVVNITTTTIIEARTDFEGLVPEGSPFEDFFNDLNRQPGDQPRPEAERANALGSGFVISADGYIVTNNHVIDGADEIQIEFFSGVVLDAKLVGTDRNTDIALLKVEAENLPFVAFGDSDLMRVGDWVMAMGNPMGQGFSVSAGIISARGRELSGSYDDFLQTDAAINKGNSGGPLFNMTGEVIGVNTAILSPDGGSIGIGFSMASNVVKSVVKQLRETGEVRRGWLGVRIQDVTPDVAEALGLDKPMGALVTEVQEGPSLDAGMLSGDLIIKFDGQDIESSGALVRKVGNTEVGKAVPVLVLREGEEVTLSVTLGLRDDEQIREASVGDQAPEGESKLEIFGMTLEVLNDELRGQFGLASEDEGLVITSIDPASDAAGKGLMVGDVIVQVAQQAITSISDFQDKIDKGREGGRKSLMILVERQGNPQFLALPLDAE